MDGMNSEKLIISQLSTISRELADVRLEQKEQSKILNKLEANYNVNERKCLLTHGVLDKKVDELISAKSKEIAKKDDWRTWGFRVLLMVPVSTLTTILAFLIKGCAL